jgi:hypothetical protein
MKTVKMKTIQIAQVRAEDIAGGTVVRIGGRWRMSFGGGEAATVLAAAGSASEDLTAFDYFDWEPSASPGAVPRRAEYERNEDTVIVGFFGDVDGECLWYAVTANRYDLFDVQVVVEV